MLRPWKAYVLVERRSVLVVNDKGVHARQAQGAAVIHFHAGPLLPASQQPTQSHALLCICRIGNIIGHCISCHAPPCRSAPRFPCHASMQPLPLRLYNRQRCKGGFMCMALVQAAPGSEALAGGALRGAVLPVAHAEALLLEQAVHAMLRSTMHQQAAKKGSQAYPDRCTTLSPEQMGNVCWLATELRCARYSRGYLQAMGCCFAGHMLSQTDQNSERAPPRRTAAEYVTVQESACCRLGCHEIAR